MRLPTELEITDEFRVSKTVAREVTAHLVSIRLVTVHHGKRMQVRPPAEWNYLDPMVFELQSAKGVRQLVRELLEARLLIEPEVAARAARSATQAQLDAMRQSVDAMGESLSSPAQFSEHDLAFHREILAAAQNRIIAGIVDDLQAVMRSGRQVTNSIPGGLKHALAGHTAVLAAVEARDPEGARTAMREHLLWAAERA